MITKELSNAQIEAMVVGLRGNPQANDGLAYQKLPVRKVVFPLLKFVEDAQKILKPFGEAKQRLMQDIQATEGEEQEALLKELQALASEVYTMRLQPICGQCLDEYELSLAELQILAPFFPEQDAPAPALVD